MGILWALTPLGIKQNKSIGMLLFGILLSVGKVLDGYRGFCVGTWNTHSCSAKNMKSHCMRILEGETNQLPNGVNSFLDGDAMLPSNSYHKSHDFGGGMSCSIWT